MTAGERRATQSLAAIFALRMLGLFLVLPVFAIEAARYPGGDDPALVGLAMGLYGLTQAIMQVPLGLASDRVGRKRVIVAGLLLFALGSAVAALAGSVQGLAVGRALQGAGAVSAAVTALLADLTRDEVRTKGMALVGASIGLTFAVSLMAAAPLTAWLGLPGLFWLTAALALAGIAVVLRWTPAEPARHSEAVNEFAASEQAAQACALKAQSADVARATSSICNAEGVRLRGMSGRGGFVHSFSDEPRGRLAEVWRHPLLWRLDLGVFVLHTVQMAMWVVVPGRLLQAGVPRSAHWQVYLPAVLASFVLMGGLFALERRGHLRAVLRGAIALLLLVQLALLALAPQAPGAWTLGVVLFAFFVAFNILEATQPSMISRLAPARARGAALGVYNTLQSLGLFAGGALGGWLLKHAGAPGVFAATALLAALWLLLGWAQQVPPARR
ncbi:MAG: MFS transporter [Ottowia sp.]|uniref:MFS transporter n=1 Tax=Ottowia sp. TaxID=1898956 RepID=UPI0039E5CF69